MWWRNTTFLVVAGTLALVVVGLVAVGFYDSARADRIPEGTTVGGVMVGDMDADAARDALRTELAEPLRRNIVARRGPTKRVLTAKASGVRVDADASVDRALERSRSGNILGRAWRGLTRADADQTLEPVIDYDRGAVDGFVTRVARRLDRDQRDAGLEFSGGQLRIASGQAGRSVDQAGLQRRVTRALTDPGASPRVTVPIDRPDAEVANRRVAKRFPTVVKVDRNKFKLTLYKKLEPVKTYRIAIGKLGYDTPAGRYTIQNKAVNPTWTVPDSDWTGSLAGQSIPPGPNNPLKARWLGIYDGVGVHGTDDLSSLGTAASHGCVRMAIPDVVELYSRVPVGTPIFII